MINNKIARSIVDKTMSIIKINVNIMDGDAKVIASGYPDRIGIFHSGADYVIKSGNKLVIESKDVASHHGVQPGITLPIMFNGSIVGAVGITGEPSEVSKYGELVRYTTELMLEQAYIKDELYLEAKAKENFFHELLSGKWGENEELFVSRSQIFDYNLLCSHLVMAVSVDFPKANDDNEVSGVLLQNQRLKDKIEIELSRGFLDYPGAFFIFINNYLAVMLPLKTKDKLFSDLDVQKKIAQKILLAVKDIANVPSTIAIGGVCESWHNIHRDFDNATYALHQKVINQDKREVVTFNDFLTEYTIDSIPSELRKEYCISIFGNLLHKKPEQRELLFETLHTFFTCDANINQTAAALFIHRNTLTFRLNKVEDITGYDPQCFNDAYKLKLAYDLLQIDEGRIHL